MNASFRLISPLDVSDNDTENTLPTNGTIRHENQAFGSKDFAFEPYNKKSSHQSLQEYLKPSAKFSQKKRKFNSDMNDDKHVTTLGFLTREKCGPKNAILNEKLRCCCPSREDYTHLSDSHEFPIELNSMKQRYLEALKSPINEDLGNSSKTSPLLCSENEDLKLNRLQNDEGNEGLGNSCNLHLLCSENEDLKLNQLQNNEGQVQRAAIPIGPRFQAEVPKWEGTSNIRYDNNDDDLKWLGVQLWPLLDVSKKKLEVIREGRCESCSCEFRGSDEDLKLDQLQNDERHVPRAVIPIGPRFQAEVPKWKGTSNIQYDNSDDDLKWLGVQLWPMPSFSEKKIEVIGEGRRESCSCEFPGSNDCIKLHISEAKELLKLEIGTTF